MVCCCSLAASAQLDGFSFSSNASLLRSFKKDQRFIVLGATSQGHFHFSPRNEAYVWFSYFTNGKFTNKEVIATAKQPATVPQQIAYSNKANMRLRHLSIGWKHYVKGTYKIEKGYSLYTLAGLGVLFGSVTNTHSQYIDTAAYNVPVLPDKGAYKRLTLDLGVGWERPLVGDFYVYAEAKALLPTTDYPTNYLFINNKAPISASVATGLRILF